jgi:hypothetical protein
MQTTDERRDSWGGLARPGPIGLAIRVVLGVVSVYALAELLTKWDVFRDKNLIESDFWFVTLFTVCLLPDVFNIALRRRWAAWPLVVFLAGGVVLGSAGSIASDEIWIVPLALWVYAGDVLVFGTLVLSFPLAIVMRTAGCEFNAVPRLIARLRGTADKETRRCILGIDLLDRWGA